MLPIMVAEWRFIYTVSQ